MLAHMHSDNRGAAIRRARSVAVASVREGTSDLPYGQMHFGYSARRLEAGVAIAGFRCGLPGSQPGRQRAGSVDATSRDGGRETGRRPFCRLLCRVSQQEETCTGSAGVLVRIQSRLLGRVVQEGRTRGRADVGTNPALQRHSSKGDTCPSGATAGEYGTPPVKTHQEQHVR